jgi:hypothetical protein
VDPLPLGHTNKTAHAPHSPSAQPSFAAINPLERMKSRRTVCGGSPSKDTTCPLSLKSGRETPIQEFTNYFVIKS